MRLDVCSMIDELSEGREPYDEGNIESRSHLQQCSNIWKRPRFLKAGNCCLSSCADSLAQGFLSPSACHAHCADLESDTKCNMLSYKGVPIFFISKALSNSVSLSLRDRSHIPSLRTN